MIDINQLSFEDIISRLNFENIPGFPAQKILSPPYREELILKNKLENKNSSRIAAVLILLYREHNAWHFPVILRNTYKGVHSNQIGFPGGKVETDDKNLAYTAKREAWEEIGATIPEIEIIGNLTELYIPPSHFTVHPFVGLYRKKPNFKPCDFEVKQIIPIPLKEFIFDYPIINMPINADGKNINVPAFEIMHEIKIWGATAMMLNEFKMFFKKSLNL